MPRIAAPMEPLVSFAMALVMVPLLAHTGLGEPPDTPSEILARSNAATGGAAWDKLQTSHVVMTMKTSGLEGTVETWEDLRTGHGVTRYALGPITGAGGFDGRVHWSQDASGQSGPEEGLDEVLGGMNEAYQRCLGYWYPERWAAEMTDAGVEQEGSRRFQRVSITPRGGRVFTLWIDTETWLFDRTVEKAALETRTTFFSDYREVGGVKLPHTVRITNGESKYDQFLSVTSVTWNVPLEDGFAAIPASAAPDYRFAGGKTESTVPFQLINNHIYVDVKLNGKGPYAFLCDTGGQNVMTPTLVKEMGLQSQGALQGRGVGEKSEDVGFTIVDALSVGDVTLDRQTFAVFPLESFGDVAGVPMHGLIGYEVFKRFVVKIDYEKKLLTLTEPAAFTYAGTGTIVPFKFDDSMPQVEGAIDGIPGVFDIDTGSRSSLSVNGPFAETHGLKAKLNPKVSAVTGWGVGGPARGLVARAGELRLGTLVVKDVVTTLSLQTKGSFSSPYEAGNVGAGVLKRFNLVFDYGKQQIIFEPNAHRDAPDVFDRSGMWVNKDGTALVVVDVTAGGPAEAAGIKAGDRILHVDDRPAAEIGLVGLRNRFRTEPAGTSIRMQVLHEGAEKGVTLVLKDLV